MPKLPTYVVDSIAMQVFAIVEEKRIKEVERIKNSPQAHKKMKELEQTEGYKKMIIDLKKLKTLCATLAQCQKEIEVIRMAYNLSYHGIAYENLKFTMENMVAEHLNTILPEVLIFNDIRAAVFLNGNANINEDVLIQKVTNSFISKFNLK